MPDFIKNGESSVHSSGKFLYFFYFLLLFFLFFTFIFNFFTFFFNFFTFIFIFKQDYGIELAKEWSMKKKEKVFRINFTCMMKGEVDSFCIFKNKVTHIKKFLDYARTLYKTERKYAST